MLAIKEGIKACLSSNRVGVTPMVVEADALEVIKSLNYESEDISDTKLVLNEVESLVANVGVITFVKCPRAGNKIAHSLTQMAAGFAPTSSPSIEAIRGHFDISSFCDSSTPEEMFFCRDDLIPNWLSSFIREELVIPNCL